ncbi:hypothetical protein NC652_012906 [Populus alba x Populus x berolinensis]|nr:hypothetical protein NC652_012906 [Populus alba x Populus x berolinensis]
MVKVTSPIQYRDKLIDLDPRNCTYLICLPTRLSKSGRRPESWQFKKVNPSNSRPAEDRRNLEKYESKFIESIVKEIADKLNLSLPHFPRSSLPLSSALRPPSYFFGLLREEGGAVGVKQKGESIGTKRGYLSAAEKNGPQAFYKHLTLCIFGSILRTENMVNSSFYSVTSVLSTYNLMKFQGDKAALLPSFCF